MRTTSRYCAVLLPGAQNGPKMVPKMVSKWSQIAKMVPKWCQNCQNGPKWSQNCVESLKDQMTLERIKLWSIYLIGILAKETANGPNSVVDVALKEGTRMSGC